MVRFLGCLLAVLLSASTHAADLPAPWVELASHGELDVRVVIAPGMPCPEVKAAANIGHIVVIGDAGCRVKDDFVQDCNEPVRCPFAQVARLAAARHPGLVMHVGDYHPPEDTLSDVAATAGFTCSVHIPLRLSGRYDSALRAGPSPASSTDL
jgi:hypothetical protein